MNEKTGETTSMRVRVYETDRGIYVTDETNIILAKDLSGPGIPPGFGHIMHHQLTYFLVGGNGLNFTDDVYAPGTTVFEDPRPGPGTLQGPYGARVASVRTIPRGEWEKIAKSFSDAKEDYKSRLAEISAKYEPKIQALRALQMQEAAAVPAPTLEERLREQK